ncbi:MAG: ATP-dependent zinc metalloprotease FtsH [Thermoguttaceae bacterium]|nr:ATP-dependent zinc metalloprotease FtsH [Thermoguttaceae bacterium]
MSDNNTQNDNQNNNGPNKNSSSKKWGFFSLPIIVLIIVVIIGITLYLQSDAQRTFTVPYMDFVMLVEQGAPEKNPKAEQVYTEKRGEITCQYRVSNISELKVGADRISGKGDFIQVSENGKPVKGELYKDRSFVSNRQGFADDGNYLFNLLKSKGFDNVDGEPGTSLWVHTLPSIIVTLILIGLIIFFIRMMGKGGAFAFGQSRGRFYKPDEINITFKDVAGIDEAVEEVKEIVEFLKTPEKYKKIGGRIPKGVLLVGPPGTGKTLLAKAIAGEAGVPFVSISGSDFVEMFVGVGAARVRDMFEQASDSAPCIVFIDELDALGKTRSENVTGGQDEREQTLNALLVEMDGFPDNNGVIVLGATNRPETLDPALLRPGRFDRHVLVDRPDLLGRVAILEIYAKKIKLDPSVDLKEIASMTSGFAGADLSNLINEAALLAARAGKDFVTKEELNEGIERVTAGLQKKQRVMHPEEKRRVAYHESAHALAAHLLPNTDPVHKVSIIPRGLAALGYTLQRPDEDRYLVTQSQLESRIMVYLAGTIAEQMFFNDISTGAQNDLQRATDVARSMVMDYGMSRLGRLSLRSKETSFIADGKETFKTSALSESTAARIDAEIEYIMETAFNETKKVLENCRFKLEALAEALLLKEVIDSEELSRILDDETENS